MDGAPDGQYPDSFLRIWTTVGVIPAGRVAGYGQIADLAGLPRRARLVGKALGNVPAHHAVPWHRVLRSDGKIAFPVGSERAQIQQGLLQSEDVVVLNNRVDMRRFGWQPDLMELLQNLKY